MYKYTPEYIYITIFSFLTAMMRVCHTGFVFLLFLVSTRPVYTGVDV